MPIPFRGGIPLASLIACTLFTACATVPTQPPAATAGEPASSPAIVYDENPAPGAILGTWGREHPGELKGDGLMMFEAGGTGYSRFVYTAGANAWQQSLSGKMVPFTWAYEGNGVWATRMAGAIPVFYRLSASGGGAEPTLYFFYHPDQPPADFTKISGS